MISSTFSSNFDLVEHYLCRRCYYADLICVTSVFANLIRFISFYNLFDDFLRVCAIILKLLNFLWFCLNSYDFNCFYINIANLTRFIRFYFLFNDFLRRCTILIKLLHVLRCCARFENTRSLFSSHGNFVCADVYKSPAGTTFC